MSADARELIHLLTLKYGQAARKVLSGDDQEETRWKGAKARETGEGVKLYYNGEDTKRNGVGIAVAESLKDSVAAVQRINDRIMSLRLDTKEGYWTIMSVYAPQTGCSEHDKDDFYLSLEEAIRSAPEGDYLSIAGDMNGHVGSGRRGVERVHGGGDDVSPMSRQGSGFTRRVNDVTQSTSDARRHVTDVAHQVPGFSRGVTNVAKEHMSTTLFNRRPGSEEVSPMSPKIPDSDDVFPVKLDQ
ncbi:unnamed protein product [Heligmosomoides polygyrus]|uniref:Endo/exonuclease/phosphatase domain-containing protein n=1 Tax=Heligmosomoides polygyrus TaxID=6339 RepID=A0A3P7ZFY7_HELPZ|nr:unnamed protein product [Heligmosomoides polygyrus]